MQAIFRDTTVSFKRLLSQYINEKMYLPGQIVTRRREIGHEMFYIIRGEFQVIRNQWLASQVRDDCDEAVAVYSTMIYLAVSS